MLPTFLPLGHLEWDVCVSWKKIEQYLAAPALCWPTWMSLVIYGQQGLLLSLSTFLHLINQTYLLPAASYKRTRFFCLIGGIFLSPTDCSWRGFVILKYFQVMPSNLSLQLVPVPTSWRVIYCSSKARKVLQHQMGSALHRDSDELSCVWSGTQSHVILAGFQPSTCLVCHIVLQ